MVVRIDQSDLPPVAMLDSSVLIPALGKAVRATDDAAAKPLFDALIASKRRILIAAPSLAELLRRASAPVPRTRLVQVVAFDTRAAEILGRSFPPEVLATFKTERKGAPLHYIKYDAMIVACAVRHHADVLITTDEAMTTLATRVNLKAVTPSSFIEPQQSLPFKEDPKK